MSFFWDTSHENKNIYSQCGFTDESFKEKSKHYENPKNTTSRYAIEQWNSAKPKDLVLFMDLKNLGLLVLKTSYNLGLTNWSITISLVESYYHTTWYF